MYFIEDHVSNPRDPELGEGGREEHHLEDVRDSDLWGEKGNVRVASKEKSPTESDITYQNLACLGIVDPVVSSMNSPHRSSGYRLPEPGVDLSCDLIDQSL